MGYAKAQAAASGRETNAAWFYKQRARGICWICRRPMDDDDPRLQH